MLSLCPPALVYLILSIIIIIVFITSHHYNAITILIKILFVILWTVILNLICNHLNPTISWILVILPYVFITFMIMFTIEMIRKDKQKFKDMIDKNIFN